MEPAPDAVDSRAEEVERAAPDAAPPPVEEEAAVAESDAGGDEAQVAGDAATATCFCLAYPDRRGGTLVAVEDCYATRAECAERRAFLRARERHGGPPAAECEAASRSVCGQSVVP